MSDQTSIDLRLFLPFRLSVLSNTISSRIATLYADAFDLTVAEWRVMAIVDGAPGITARDVTLRAAMDKVAVSRAVASLEAVGRMERRAVDADGRARALFLTAEGACVVAAVAPLALDIEDRLLAALGEEDRAQLDRLLSRLANAISPDRPLW